MKYAAIINHNPPGFRGGYTPSCKPDFIHIGNEKELERFIRNGGKYDRIIKYEEVNIRVQVSILEGN